MSAEIRKKPKFAEAMTQVRHASTVIRRLGEHSASVSGTEHPVPSMTGELDASERTYVAGMTGFGIDGGEPSGSRTDPNILVEASRSGLRDLPGVRDALPSLASAPALDGPHGEIIVVFGCRGGAGATTVAVNLGVELARGTRGCAIVDLDLQMGDVLCALDLQPTATIAEVLQEIDELDEASLRRRLTAHGTGLFALSQADRFDQLEQLQPDRIPALIAGLSRQFGTIIIDGLRDFSDLSISALDMADRIILVVPEDVAAVKNASRCLDVFRRLGYASGKLSLVVNRHDGKSKVTPAAIAATLRLEPLAVLASDLRAAQDSLDEGQPLRLVAPKSPLTQSLGLLGERLSRGDVQAARPATGLLDRLRALFGGGGR